MSTIPSQGIYQTVIQGFYGNLTEAGKDALWQQFLSQSGFTAQTINPSSLSTQQLFVNFIGESFNDTGGAALSPDEIQKRTVMLQAFNIAIDMLTTLQNTVTVQTKNLDFYTKWQQEYTKMMASVPTYLSNSSNAIGRPSTNPNDYDPSTFTFGYDNISVKDITDYVVSATHNNSNGSGSFSFGNFATNNFAGFSINGVSQSQYTWTVTMSMPAGFVIPAGANPALSQLSQTNNSILLTSSSPPGSTTRLNMRTDGSISIVVQQVSVPSSESDATKAQHLSDGFKWIYYNVLGNPKTTNDPGFSTPANPPNVYDATAFPNIPWQSNLLGTTDTAIKLRAEENTALQQYIENIRSYRQAVQDTATTVQTNLGTTREGINQQANLLNAIITTMQTIIGTMFK